MMSHIHLNLFNEVYHFCFHYMSFTGNSLWALYSVGLKMAELGSKCLTNSNVKTFVVTVAHSDIDPEIKFLIGIDHITDTHSTAVIDIFSDQIFEIFVPEFGQTTKGHRAPTLGTLPGRITRCVRIFRPT